MIPAEYLGKIPAVKVDAGQLNLAKQLIKSYTRPLELDKFTDHYETAVRELVEAKLANKPLAPGKTRKGPRQGRRFDVCPASEPGCERCA